MTKHSGGRGKLIALEGTGGRSMAIAVKLLERNLRRQGTEIGSSVWDASGIFFQIAQGARGLPAPPPRTLILLYASDLAFRLRWQIRPALEDGASVIAAPYLESVIGFGRAAGLSQAWLRRLFEFAPAPDETYRVPEGTIPVDRRGSPANSFLEFGFAQLRGGPGSWDIEAIRQNFGAHLDRLELRGKCLPLPPRQTEPAVIAQTT